MDRNQENEPPEDNPASNPTNLECSACTEEYHLHEIVRIDGDIACVRCIREIFSNAIQDESNFPPRWGSQELDPNTYRTVLGDTIHRLFEQKAAEYEVLWNDRVYCPTRNVFGLLCGTFIGQRNLSLGPVACHQCGSFVCMCCKEHVVGRRHRCAVDTDAGEEHFGDLRRGKEWQKCPSCKTKVQLTDGCNHISCLCGADFCFICGGPAAANSNHWSRSNGSRCPRYNQPGAANAIYEDQMRPGFWNPFHPLDVIGADIRLNDRENLRPRLLPEAERLDIADERLRQQGRFLTAFNTIIDSRDTEPERRAALMRHRAQLERDIAAAEAARAALVRVMRFQGPPGVDDALQHQREEDAVLEREVQIPRDRRDDRRWGPLDMLRGAARHVAHPWRFGVRDPVRPEHTVRPAQAAAHASVLASRQRRMAMDEANMLDGIHRVAGATNQALHQRPPLAHPPFAWEQDHHVQEPAVFLLPRERRVPFPPPPPETFDHVRWPVAAPLNPPPLHPDDIQRRAPRRRAAMVPEPQRGPIHDRAFHIPVELATRWNHHRQFFGPGGHVHDTSSFGESQTSHTRDAVRPERNLEHPHAHRPPPVGGQQSSPSTVFPLLPPPTGFRLAGLELPHGNIVFPAQDHVQQSLAQRIRDPVRPANISNVQPGAVELELDDVPFSAEFRDIERME